MNIGTSGRVWLHCPNAYVGIEQTKVTSGAKYQIPGQLLPSEDLMRNGLDYIEVGPPGWEELAVIITPEPIILTLTSIAPPLRTRSFDVQRTHRNAIGSAFKSLRR